MGLWLLRGFFFHSNVRHFQVKNAVLINPVNLSWIFRNPISMKGYGNNFLKELIENMGH